MSDPAPAFPHLVIRASAGTGKTFRLAHRFLGLLLSGHSPDNVLAATFARKAAGEIIDRILVRLAEAIESPQKLAELAEHVGRPSLTRQACVDLLRTLLSRLHRLRIGTLDSFFVQLAGHFGFELGLPLGWKIIDEVDEQDLRDEAIQAVLASESTSDAATLVGLLFKGEARRSITAQVRSLVASLYDLYRLTGGEAWRQLPRHGTLEDREWFAALDVLETLPPIPGKSMSEALVKDLERVRQRDWLGFISAGLGKAVVRGNPKYGRQPIPAELFQALEPFAAEARAQLVNALANQTEATLRLLEKYDREIRRLKQQRRSLRFEDVTRELAGGLREGDVSTMAFRLDGHVGHLLLDEFQDTSLAQWTVVRPFAEQVTNDSGRGSFFCVGDVKQAIYGWRGGVSEIFDCIREQLPGIREDVLATSYRSSPVIIDTVNRVYQTMGSNPVLADFPAVASAWHTRFSSHETAKRDLLGHARLVVSPAADETQTAEEALLGFAAAEIARLVQQHPQRSVGVLVRRNKTVAQLMHLLRSKHQLPASEEGGNPLTDSAAVQLALSGLKLADHPQDTIARFHVARSPLGKLLDLTQFDDDAAAERISRALRSTLLAEGYGRTLLRWLPAIAELCDPRELQRFEQLIELAYGYDERATLRSDDFAALVEVEKVEDPSAAKVRVMTVHQAKGLQFDIVVLPELDQSLKARVPQVVVEQQHPIDPILAVCRYASEEVQSLLPVRFQRLFDAWSGPVIHEALCVLYVALTRPVHALHMIIKPADEQPGALKFSTKSPTYATILRAALAPDKPREPQEVLFECGTANWDVAEFVSPEPAGRDKPELVDVKLKDVGRKARGLQRQSPSGLQGGPTVNLQNRLNVDADAGRRGSVIHAWFETIEWIDQHEPDDATLDRIALRNGGQSRDLDAWRDSFRRMLKQPTIGRTLSQRSYLDNLTRELKVPSSTLVAEVWRERRFAVRDGDVLLQGAMDRVVVLRQGSTIVAVDIIDFKSDQLFDDADLQAKIEYYRPQLLAYRRAVLSMLSVEAKRVRTRLLFVEHDRAVEVK